MIGIGIIGSGFMGRTHAETIVRYTKGARLVAVAGGSRAPALAKDYGIECEADVQALVARRDVDAVMITTPHAVHAEHALLAAYAGKHVLIEKPMAATVRECDRIIDACAGSRTRCTISFHQRFRKCNRAAKMLIKEGRIGRVLQVRESQLQTGGIGGLPDWQNDPANLGILFGHGIHNIDRLRWLTGSEIRTVYAKCGALDREARVEGTSVVLMTTTSDVVASFWSSFEIPAPGFPQSSYQAWIVGEKGLIDLDGYGELKVTSGGKWETVEVQEPIDWVGKGKFDPVRMQSYRDLNQDFIDSIREDREPAVTGRDGRQAVAVALAAYESGRTGKEVVLS